jgi:hypothetical protein
VRVYCKRMRSGTRKISGWVEIGDGGLSSLAGKPSAIMREIASTLLFDTAGGFLFQATP